MLEDAVVELSQAFEIEEGLSNLYGLRTVTQKLTHTLARLDRRQDALNYCDRAVVATDSHPDLVHLRNNLICRTSGTNRG